MQKFKEIESEKTKRVSAIVRCALYPQHFLLVKEKQWQFPSGNVESGEEEEHALKKTLEEKFGSKAFSVSMRLPYGIAFKGKKVVESETIFFLVEFEGKVEDLKSKVEAKIVPRHSLANHLNNSDLLATVCVMETQGFL